MTAFDAPKIGMDGRRLRQAEGARAMGEAPCGQTPEFGMRRMLKAFAVCK